MSEHAFERPTSSQVLEQLMTTASEHRRSLELPPQLQLCSHDTPPSPAALETSSTPLVPRKRLLQPLQSFPVFQALVGMAAPPRNLREIDVAEQELPVSPACMGGQKGCEPPMRQVKCSRSFSLAGGDTAVRGSVAHMAATCGSKASTQILASPRLCSNTVADSSSASQARVSGMWSSVFASDVQRGVPLHGEMASNGGLVGEGCRTSMPHTTSVRFGLASVMRPLSAQSSSVSGWLSEGSTSMSFASHATAY
jgi:hypothetical protein